MVPFLKDFLAIAAELTFLFVAITILISFLQSLIPLEKVEKKIKSTNKLFASFLAVFFAFLTPFCSCSTIPIVVHLLKNKIPFGIVMVFLFASPVLDPTILTIMGVMLGWKVTILYTLLTSLLTIIIGLVIEALGFERYVKQVVMKNFASKASESFSFHRAWREVLTLMRDVFPYLLIGAGIGAGIHNFVPTEWISEFLGDEKWWLVPVAAVIGIPLYIRLSSMIPISQILVMKGMALGSVMALLISSAGASLPEVVMLKSIFKKELVMTFLVSIFTMASTSGFIFYLI
ncbi:permease [Salinibacillus xinjiangensis]|uniref:Permease n=1 Tax=Salinibacillus xinjiangensis TaxID=1229268 RepID=A0A6G1X871_9BACI|nr:permease [Salinibacillus xinjiangensis]MRG87129.1 permease [Salinibacillus xinjiangensis]